MQKDSIARILPSVSDAMTIDKLISQLQSDLPVKGYQLEVKVLIPGEEPYDIKSVVVEDGILYIILEA